MSSARRRFLVTGGAGFVGSHLVDRLLSDGQQVTVLSRTASRESPNLAHLAAYDGLRVVAASAADVGLLDAELPGHDYVFHLAGLSGPALAASRPLEAIQSIIGVAEPLLEACARHLVPILLTSTSAVYGRSPRVPSSEGDDLVIGPPTGPAWSYAAAKALVEHMAFARARESGLQVCVVRLFNTAGLRQRQMVLPNFVDWALNGESLTIHGDGSQRRCFCSVYDVVAGLVALSSCAAAAGQIVNIGSQEEISIAELARRVVERSGSRSKVTFVPYQAAHGFGLDEVPRSLPDISRIRGLVGWTPTADLNAIIDDLIAHWTLRPVARTGAPSASGDQTSADST